LFEHSVNIRRRIWCCSGVAFKAEKRDIVVIATVVVAVAAVVFIIARNINKK